MAAKLVPAFIFALLFAAFADSAAAQDARPRVREFGITIGVLSPGENNAITDVSGVLVGHSTLISGDRVRTGVTSVLPHTGNLFKEKVPAAIFVGNGFGKLAGSTQVNELGEIETPILLTSTLSVPRTADLLIDHMLALPGNENVRSINPVVAETNDGTLNDIRSRPITRDAVVNAIRSARSGPVDEGAVGAGTGTVAFGWKGGIGTASRKLPPELGGFTVGVLVQSNFGGVLSIDGVPVGKELGRHYLKNVVGTNGVREKNPSPDGSIIIVIATDAPLDHRQLYRVAARSMSGLARTGSSMTNGSGDYAIAFSTATRISADEKIRSVKVLGNDAMSPLFQAVIETTEEAILNSMFKAVDMTGNGNTVNALPLEKVREIMKKYGRIEK